MTPIFDGANATCYRLLDRGARQWPAKKRAVVTTSEDGVSAYEASNLVRSHGAYVWRTLCLLGVRPADVDDLTQEVLLIAIARRHTHEGRGTLRSWIRGICVKKAAGHRRKAQVRLEVASDSVSERGSTQHPDDVLDQSRKLQRLRRALGQLDEAQRAAFVLYEIEGLTMKEVAAALGCPLQTAYSRHAAARRRVIADMRRGELAGGPIEHERDGGCP